MEEIILHHYDVSPFSEKIRKILAHKGLAWRGVEQPIIAPKPKLTPLTGGYRKIPVLQIGADVYCDTALIVHVLEERKPEPSCFDGGVGAHEMIAHWADHWLFLAAVPPAIVRVIDTLPTDFIKDRAAMSPGFNSENILASIPDCRSRLAAAIDWLDGQLRDRDFLLGASFGVADAACFHSMWFLRNEPEIFSWIASRPALRRWFERIDAMGRGEMTPLDPDEALDVARRSLPLRDADDGGEDPNGLHAGDRVSVVADDYGIEQVTGKLVRTSAREIVLRREDPSVGEVIVHFPRVGYRVTRFSAT
jgi:glutathione S-transferase